MMAVAIRMMLTPIATTSKMLVLTRSEKLVVWEPLDPAAAIAILSVVPFIVIVDPLHEERFRANAQRLGYSRINVGEIEQG